jgi:hypothetical protein
MLGKSDEDQFESLAHFHRVMLRESLEQGIKKFKESTTLRLNYANFLVLNEPLFKPSLLPLIKKSLKNSSL